MLTAEALIRKGFFPKELPPTFCSNLLADLFQAEGESLPLEGKWTECARHNLARLGGFRRPLSVPNPRSYINLAIVLEADWGSIDEHLNSEKFGISRPVVTRTRERAVRPRYQLGPPELRARMWRGQRFVLRADVSQCYSSLYTHAIPWALHTKRHAKANMGQTDGDRIDKAVRACSSGQTVGIPIGPDTSFVIAEVVLTAVDARLKSSIPDLRGFRYMDDYEAAFSTRAGAEEAQAHLEGALGEFELVINPFKTKVLELPQPFKATWTNELAAFPIRDESPRKALNDTVALFSRASEIAEKHLGALTYALRKSREIAIDSLGWPTFQNLVWNAVSVEPTTMALALDLLMIKSEEVNVIVNKASATEVLEALVRTHGPLRNASEVAWALWAAIELEVDLSDHAATVISEMDDDFVALLALDARARGRIGAGLDTDRWERLIDYDEALSGDHWLLAYESAARGWLTAANERVNRDPFFGLLRQRGIHFYDPDPARDPFTGPAAPPPGMPVPDSYA